MLTQLREAARKGKQMLGIRELLLLAFVAACVTAVELMALAKGVDGVGLAAFFGVVGVVFGGASVTMWKKMTGKKD